MSEEEWIIFLIQSGKNTYMPCIKRVEQHRSFGRILQEKIRRILGQAERKENVLKVEN